MYLLWQIKSLIYIKTAPVSLLIYLTIRICIFTILAVCDQKVRILFHWCFVYLGYNFYFTGFIWAMISVPVLFYLSYDFCSSIVLFELWFLFQYCSIWAMISVPVVFYLSYDFCVCGVFFGDWVVVAKRAIVLVISWREQVTFSEMMMSALY